MDVRSTIDVCLPTEQRALVRVCNERTVERDRLRTGLGLSQLNERECPNGRERPGFRAAQGVFAIAVVNQLALSPAWQVKVSAERVPDLASAVSIVAIGGGPAEIVITISSLRV